MWEVCRVCQGPIPGFRIAGTYDFSTYGTFGTFCVCLARSLLRSANTQKVTLEKRMLLELVRQDNNVMSSGPAKRVRSEAKPAQPAQPP